MLSLKVTRVIKNVRNENDDMWPVNLSEADELCVLQEHFYLDKHTFY